MDGVEALKVCVQALRQVEPEDPLLPFLAPLIRFIDGVITETPEPGALDQQVVEVPVQIGVLPQDGPHYEDAILSEVVGPDPKG